MRLFSFDVFKTRNERRLERIRNDYVTQGSWLSDQQAKERVREITRELVDNYRFLGVAMPKREKNDMSATFMEGKFYRHSDGSTSCNACHQSIDGAFGDHVCPTFEGELCGTCGGKLIIDGGDGHLCECPTTEEAVNPKNAVGQTKVPLSCVPEAALMHWAIAQYEGNLKYGKHNCRVSPVKASIYLDAHDRHVTDWKNGVQVDQDSGVHHLGYAMACLGLLIDAEVHGTLYNDLGEQTGIMERVLDAQRAVVERLHELYGTDTRPLNERDSK